MKNTTTVVMLLDNPLISDSRVEKEAVSFINSGFNVIVYCVSDKNLPLEETQWNRYQTHSQSIFSKAFW